MKRHEALIPFSREHHDALILSRLIQKGAPVYRGLPTRIKEKADYALELFSVKLKQHFTAEEKMLALINTSDKELLLLFNEIRAEHVLLEHQFISLQTAQALEEKLDKLGRDLEQHIRKEERVLFELIQERCSEDVLEKIKMIIH